MALNVVETSLCPEDRLPDTSLIQFWVAVKEETYWESNPGITFHNH